jgi:hypothetical protein
MKTVIFLGPSLSPVRARTILDATYLPPAAMGDLYGALALRPQVIGLVDGLFEQVPAVWHKEILFALSSGVHVYGASSMGALRAAELYKFGMRGVGRIFEAYASGELEDDDEVAVVHRPASEGFLAISEAMVNIRFALAEAEAAQVVSTRTRQRLVELAKESFYPERSWPSLRRMAEREGLPKDELERLFSFVQQATPNAKRDDACAMIERIRDDCAAGLQPHHPNFEFQPSVFWERIKDSQRRVGIEKDSGPESISFDELIRYVRLTSDIWSDIAAAALLSRLARREDDRHEITIGAEQLNRTVEIYRREHRLLSADEMQQWLSSRGLTPEAFTETMHSAALIDALFLRYRDELGTALERELKMRGLFAQAVATIERKRRIVRETFIHQPSPTDIGLSEQGLIAWYEKRYRPLGGSPDVHATEIGFLNRSEFMAELVALYLLDQAAP